MRIGIAFDLAPDANGAAGDGPDDRFEEFDKPETITALADVLRSEGYDVSFLGDGRGFLQRVLADPPDLVWNMAEGEGVGRCRESRVPAVLEMLGIPYTGSDPLTLAAALDKDVAKRIVAAAGVVVPGGTTIEPGIGRNEATVGGILDRFADRVSFPWIVKPAFEGSSKGIRSRCVVDGKADALDLIDRLRADYAQPILVEEYVAGDEVTVGILGEGASAEVIGTMGVLPRARADRFVYSLEMKRDWQSKVAYETPANLPEETLSRLTFSAMNAYHALGCRDVARIDYRVRDGIPYFLEANPLPGLAPDWSDLVILGSGYGLTHADLIRRILDAALRRLGLGEKVAGAVTP